MTLEFTQIVPQVYKMGTMLENLDFDIEDAMTLALTRFRDGGDMEAVWERINWVRESDISGYRGAAPLPLDGAEDIINLTYPPPELPPQAAVIAVDGSQVYPDEQAEVHYYLLNIGAFMYYHGAEHTPRQLTFPDLRFHKSHVHDRYGRLISNRTVDDRRTVRELQTLANLSWEHRDFGVPIVSLYDNRLMYLPGGDDTKESIQNMNEYIGALVHLHDAGATLAGYVDNPFRSKRFIQLLYLLSIESKAELRQKQNELARCGDLEGLRDMQFFARVLRPGYRSAIMVQSSPQNLEFRRKGENYEIAFFYLKVANGYTARTVRVDVPLWVARDPQRVETLHSILLHQCRMQGRNPYPYAITRADEMAYVGSRDRAKLDELVTAQVRRIREEMAVNTLTAKARGKELARSGKRYHSMWGEEVIDDR